MSLNVPKSQTACLKDIQLDSGLLVHLKIKQEIQVFFTLIMSFSEPPSPSYKAVLGPQINYNM